MVRLPLPSPFFDCCNYYLAASIFFFFSRPYFFLSVSVFKGFVSSASLGISSFLLPFLFPRLFVLRNFLDVEPGLKRHSCIALLSQSAIKTSNTRLLSAQSINQYIRQLVDRPEPSFARRIISINQFQRAGSLPSTKYLRPIPQSSPKKNIHIGNGFNHDPVPSFLAASYHASFPEHWCRLNQPIHKTALGFNTQPRHPASHAIVLQPAKVHLFRQ